MQRQRPASAARAMTSTGRSTGSASGTRTSRPLTPYTGSATTSVDRGFHLRLRAAQEMWKEQGVWNPTPTKERFPKFTREYGLPGYGDHIPSATVTATGYVPPGPTTRRPPTRPTAQHLPPGPTSGGNSGPKLDSHPRADSETSCEFQMWRDEWDAVFPRILAHVSTGSPPHLVRARDLMHHFLTGLEQVRCQCRPHTYLLLKHITLAPRWYKIGVPTAEGVANDLRNLKAFNRDVQKATLRGCRSPCHRK